jgi:hypothetical protein
MEDKMQPKVGERDTNTAKIQLPKNSTDTDIDSACCDRIKALIFAQKTELEGTQLTLDQMMRDMEELKKRRKIAKKALKRAKLNKLGKNKISLIADDLKAIKEDRLLLKALIKEKSQQTENLERLIALLETLI